MLLPLAATIALSSLSVPAGGLQQHVLRPYSAHSGTSLAVQLSKAPKQQFPNDSWTTIVRGTSTTANPEGKVSLAEYQSVTPEKPHMNLREYVALTTARGAKEAWEYLQNNPGVKQCSRVFVITYVGSLEDCVALVLKRGPTEALIDLPLLHNLLAKGIIPAGNAVANLSANSWENYSLTDEKTGVEYSITIDKMPGSVVPIYHIDQNGEFVLSQPAWASSAAPFTTATRLTLTLPATAVIQVLGTNGKPIPKRVKCFVELDLQPGIATVKIAVNRP